MSTDMVGKCKQCGQTTADYVVTAEMIYSLCDTCFYVDVIQLARNAA
jgi:hypothetical protein